MARELAWAVDRGARGEGGEETVNAADPAEPALVLRARADRSAFAELYRRHYGAIGGYLYRRTGDVHATEDLLAETFTSALACIDGFEARGVPFLHWLYRIASNHANRWARRARRRPLSLEAAAAVADPGDGAPEQVTRHEECVDVTRALLTLAPRHQTALALHHLEGLRVDEIARALSLRPGTVKSRLARGRAALERHLQPRR